MERNWGRHAAALLFYGSLPAAIILTMGVKPSGRAWTVARQTVRQTLRTWVETLGRATSRRHVSSRSFQDGPAPIKDHGKTSHQS